MSGGYRASLVRSRGRNRVCQVGRSAQQSCPTGSSSSEEGEAHVRRAVPPTGGTCHRSDWRRALPNWPLAQPTDGVRDCAGVCDRCCVVAGRDVGGLVFVDLFRFVRRARRCTRQGGQSVVGPGRVLRLRVRPRRGHGRVFRTRLVPRRRPRRAYRAVAGRGRRFGADGVVSAIES